MTIRTVGRVFGATAAIGVAADHRALAQHERDPERGTAVSASAALWRASPSRAIDSDCAAATAWINAVAPRMARRSAEASLPQRWPPLPSPRCRLPRANQRRRTRLASRCACVGVVGQSHPGQAGWSSSVFMMWLRTRGRRSRALNRPRREARITKPMSLLNDFADSRTADLPEYEEGGLAELSSLSSKWTPRNYWPNWAQVW